MNYVLFRAFMFLTTALLRVFAPPISSSLALCVVALQVVLVLVALAEEVAVVLEPLAAVVADGHGAGLAEDAEAVQAEGVQEAGRNERPAGLPAHFLVTH